MLPLLRSLVPHLLHSAPAAPAVPLPRSVGGAQFCLDAARAYVSQRQQFGAPLASYQATQFKVADMATQIQARSSFEWMLRCGHAGVCPSVCPAAAHLPAPACTCLRPPQASRLMVRHAAAALDARSPGATLACAQAKRFATDACYAATNDALQLLGGYG